MSYGGFSAALCRGLSFESGDVIVVGRYPGEVSFPGGQPGFLGTTSAFDLSQIKPGQIAAFGACFFSYVDGGQVGFRWYGPQGNLISYSDRAIPQQYDEEGEPYAWEWYWMGSWLLYYFGQVTNGDYRLDILYNGSVVRSIPFTITGVVQYKGAISRVLIRHEPLESWEEVYINHKIRQIPHGAAIHIAVEVVNEANTDTVLHTELTMIPPSFQVTYHLQATENQDRVAAPGESFIVRFEPFIAEELSSGMDDYTLISKLSVAGLVDYVWELAGAVRDLLSVDNWTEPYPDGGGPGPIYQAEISRLLMWHELLPDWKEIYLDHKVWEIPLGAEIHLSVEGTNKSDRAIPLYAEMVITPPDGNYFSLQPLSNQGKLTQPGESLIFPFEPFVASQISTWKDDYIISIKLCKSIEAPRTELVGMMISIATVEDWEPEEPEEVVSFSLTRPSVSPPEITPGTTATIRSTVTSACTKSQTVTAKVKIYEGSALPGHGTLITTKTSSPFTIAPGRSCEVIVTHRAIAGTIDRRDIEVEIYIGGNLVKESEWDDVYYVAEAQEEPEEPGLDWLPMLPHAGPPLPRWMGITWPWYQEETEGLGLHRTKMVGGSG